jgi:hypothetical protein
MGEGIQTYCGEYPHNDMNSSRRVLAAILTLTCFSVPIYAQANPQSVEYTRAVSYWYVPTAQDDVFRLYQMDIKKVEDLTNGQVKTTAVVITDTCNLEGSDVMSCGNGRKERTSRKAELTVADDLSSAKAVIKLGGQTSVIHLEEKGAGTGLFELDRRCSTTEQKLVVGETENLTKAHGRLLGKRLDGPYSSGWDHAWVERGHGVWCGP